MEADTGEKGDNGIGGIGEEDRDPMALVHVVSGIDTVGGTEGAEHLGRELEVDHINKLVAVKAKLAPWHAHHDCIPFAAVGMTEYRRLKIVIKRIVRHGAVGALAVREKVLFCHKSLD